MWNHSLKVLGLGPSAEFACMHACLRGFLLQSKSMHVRIITPWCQCVRDRVVCFCNPEVSRWADGEFQKPGL